MKICFVGPATSAHIVKWAKWFSAHRHEIHVVSFLDGDVPGATVHSLSTGLDGGESDLAKLKYLFQGRRIRRMVEQIKPDVVNVHYATSYGTAVALSGLKGYVLSVWGSDVYDFPNKSPLHREMLKYSLRRAKYLFSTSKAMADETHKYTGKDIAITPFGVDMELFTPEKRRRETAGAEFVIGTVKTLAPVYHIDCIVEALAIIRKRHPEIPIFARIAGSGPQKEALAELAVRLGVDDRISWLGYISQEQCAVEWAGMDVAIIPSRRESFGVAAVEAQACGTPVIVSDAGGLLETTVPGETSVAISPMTGEACAEAILRLYREPDTRKRMSEAASRFVRERYEYNQCFRTIEDLLKNIAEKH